MMYDNVLFWLLLVAHLLGDFYMQSQEMADEKRKKFTSLLFHSGVYTIPIIILFIPIFSLQLIIAILIIAITHFFIDLVKTKIKEEFISNTRKFIIDQCLHIAIISIIAYIYAINNWIAINFIGDFLISTYNSLQITFSPKEFSKLFFVILMIGKPANILIQELNKKYHTEKDDKNESKYKNAGKIIGTVERILIVIMILLKQYSSIGLIFTAKTITRYDKITKDPSFAEYYLVGTLLSLLVAILAMVFVNMT